MRAMTRGVAVAGTAVAGLLSHVIEPQAQTPLPGIVVTAPSPVVKRRPAPRTQPATPAADSAQDEPADLSVDSTLPGTLIVSDDAFVPVTVTTAQELEATRGATITDTLQSKPGISGSTFAPGANRPIIRGLDNFRVRIQENGIGSHDVSALSEDHAFPIDPFAADRVEVVRGPATLRYGSQAIGGVVAVENDRIPTAVPPRGFSSELRGGLQSVDDGRDGAFKVTAGSAAGFVVHADGFKRQTDDYDTPRGKQANTFVDSEGFSVGTSYVWQSGFAGIAFSRFSSLYGIPGEEALEARPRIDMTQDKVMSKGEWRVRDYGIEAIRYWFGASDYAHNEVIFEQADGHDIVGTRFTNKEQEGRIEVQHLPVTTGLGELRGAVGAQWGHRKVAGIAVDEPIDALLSPATTNTTAGFIFEELQLTRRLRLQAAARIEQADVNGQGLLDFSDPNNPVAFAGERSFTPVSASLGALYELPLGVVARLTGQYVERAPDAAELLSKGVHEATGTFEIGNPLLEKEDASTIELGFKRAQGRFRFDASVYYSKFNGFIYKQLTGVDCAETLSTCGDGNPGNDLAQVLYQQRDATFYGAELAAQYDILPIWRGVLGVDTQYDFVRAQFANGENVPRIPPHRLGGGLYYRDANWFARAGILHAFKQDEIGINEIETPDYTLVSAQLSYTTKLEQGPSWASEMTIGIKGENLADDVVLNHASFKRREDVLLPGASVRLFGSIKFN
jgi:iron complex outermembrane recepter protein